MSTTIRKILLMLLMVLPGITVFSQTINTTAGTVTSCPGEIVVPVSVTNCNGIGAISLVLNYNNTHLTYVGYQNLNSALTVGFLIINNTGNSIVISWANTTAANLGNSTMVQLRFNAIAGSSALNWDTQTPGNCEYSDVLGNLLAASFTNGAASINQSPTISTQPADVTILVGQNTSFSVGASGAGLAYLWQISTNGGATFTDLANNSTYSGVAGSTLYITSAALTMNGYKYRCRLTGSCSPVVYSNVVTLGVILPVITSLPTASSCPGSIIVPVTVSNFNGVAAFSLAFFYNPTCLTYTGYQSVNGALSGGLIAVNAAGGEVFITWSSSSALTMANGTIVEILFTTASGSSQLTWDLVNEGYCEYVTLSGSPITSVYNHGSETIHYLPAITSHPSDKIIAKTQGTSFSATATGTGLSYLWQVSTNGGSTYADLTNSAPYSNVTTPTMTITNAQLSMSGYKYRCKVTGTCSPVVYSNGATLTVLPNIYTTCGSYTGCPGAVVIPVTVTDFIGVGAFSLTLAFNSSVLTYTGYQNLHSSLSAGSFAANAAGGKVYLTWSNISAATVPNGAILLELLFTAVPGSSALTWDTQTQGNCEYSDPDGLIIFSTWINGNTTIYTPPSISAQPVNATIHGGGSTSFSVSAGGTGVAYLWKVSTNGGISYSNLSNTAPYSGVTTSTMTINPAATGMNGYLYQCLVSGTCAPSQVSNTAMLTVTQNIITTYPSNVANSCTGNLSIPINVTNCSNVGSISLTLVYDTTKMSFEGYHTVNPALSGGLLAVNRVANKVYFTWASSSALNLGSGILVYYRFRANASVSTSLTWDTQNTGACEYSDTNGMVLTSSFNPSTITTQANALVVNAGPNQVKTGVSVQLNGSATGGTLPYTWLWSPSASLNNPAIANPVATPTVTTTYTLTVSAAGCSGTDLMDVTVTGPPENLAIQNENVPSGTNNCYNATNTITVAGSNTTFIVQAGGSAVMIAGAKISYLPGTRVYSGGYMHGYITSNGQYCNTPTPPIMAVQTGISSIPVTEIPFCKVYPNPANDRFTVELIQEHQETARIMCFGYMGELIFSEEIAEGSKMDFSIGDRPSGIYFIHVITKDHQETRKLILHK